MWARNFASLLRHEYRLRVNFNEAPRRYRIA